MANSKGQFVSVCNWCDHVSMCGGRSSKSWHGELRFRPDCLRRPCSESKLAAHVVVVSLLSFVAHDAKEETTCPGHLTLDTFKT